VKEIGRRRKISFDIAIDVINGVGGRNGYVKISVIRQGVS
jgi:predicted ATP-grasp superfamily ATP-dependent carboligase